MEFLELSGGRDINCNNIVYVYIKKRKMIELDECAKEHCSFGEIHNPLSRSKLIAKLSNGERVVIGKYFTNKAALEALHYMESMINEEDIIPVLPCESRDFVPWRAIFKEAPSRENIGELLVYRKGNKYVERAIYENGTWIPASNNSCLYEIDSEGNRDYSAKYDDYWVSLNLLHVMLAGGQKGKKIKKIKKKKSKKEKSQEGNY